MKPFLSCCQLFNNCLQTYSVVFSTCLDVVKEFFNNKKKNQSSSCLLMSSLRSLDPYFKVLLMWPLLILISDSLSFPYVLFL